MRPSSAVSRGRRAVRDIERAGRLLARADTPSSVIDAGSDLVTASVWLRGPRPGGGVVAELHAQGCALRNEATVLWAERSDDDAVRAAALSSIDPGGSASPRLALAALRLPNWQAPLLQLSLSCGLLLDGPERVWESHHQVLAVTDFAAGTLAAGGRGVVRVDRTGVQTAIVPSAAVAETAANLWDPGSPESAYVRLSDAVAAAKALTGDRSVASDLIREWVAGRRP